MNLLTNRFSTKRGTFSVGYAADTSARNRDYPGWIYTHYGSNGLGYPLSLEITASDLNAISNSSTIRRLSHTFNARIDYPSEAHPVPSPDGMRVVFQSNWTNRGGNFRGTDAYVIDLRNLLPFNYDFELGTSDFNSTWTVSSSNQVWRSSSAGDGSPYGMRMKSISGGGLVQSTLSNAVSTVGFTNIQVQYAIATFGLTGSHKVYLDWYDGTTWTSAADTVGLLGGWDTRTVNLPAGAAGKSGFKIRFRIDGTSSSEYANIDRVKVIAQ